MKMSRFFYRVYDLYADGFRNMKLGRTLWTIIIIKLFIMFFVLKLFFFPNFLSIGWRQSRVRFQRDVGTY